MIRDGGGVSSSSSSFPPSPSPSPPPISFSFVCQAIIAWIVILGVASLTGGPCIVYARAKAGAAGGYGGYAVVERSLEMPTRRRA